MRAVRVQKDDHVGVSQREALADGGAFASNRVGKDFGAITARNRRRAIARMTVHNDYCMGEERPPFTISPIVRSSLRGQNSRRLAAVYANAEVTSELFFHRIISFRWSH